MRQFGARPLPDVLFSFDSAAATVARTVAEQSGASLVDLPSRMNGQRELSTDPVHYSEAGAAVLATEVSPRSCKPP